MVKIRRVMSIIIRLRNTIDHDSLQPIREAFSFLVEVDKDGNSDQWGEKKSKLLKTLVEVVWIEGSD